MTCGPSSNGEVSGGGGPGFDVDEEFTTTDATPHVVHLAQLVNNADGNGVTVAVSVFALSRPVAPGGQLSYNFWGFAARQGVASGAVQYGDITALAWSGGGFVLSTTVLHEVIVTVTGYAAIVDWRVTAKVIPLRGATP